MAKETAPEGAVPRSGIERIFFIPDLHCPYNDKRATELMFDVLNDFKPDTVVIMGDFVDCLSVSHWSKDPRDKLSLEDEMEAGKAYLDRITAKKKVYIAGNHEDRLQRYLQDKAPEMLAFNDIPRLLDLKAKGWQYIPYKAYTTIGKMHLTHDVGSAGRYNVFKTLDTFQSSVITAHTHRLGYVVEGDATGGCQVSAQFGWLGDVDQVSYMHQINARRNWVLGFGVGYHDRGTGLVYAVPVPIVKYTASVEGKVYKRRKR